jgi:SAM-dependent methyltransferase
VKKDHLAKILAEYEALEPGESDTWNPLYSYIELKYRLSLFYSINQAIAKIPTSIESMRVLDIGCGNGRSTRMYLDLGLRPEQITGLDIRPDAIVLARKLHPSIRYLTYDGETLPFDVKGFNWISVTTVFSSISPEYRRTLVNQINGMLQRGGYLFYYDMLRSNPFAGRDYIHPIQLFHSFKPLWHYTVRAYQFIPLSLRFRLFLKGLTENGQIIKHIRRSIGQIRKPSHEVLLAQKCA